MAIRIAPDKDAPSIAVEIPLERPLPDYDLDQVEQPTPRDVDGVLVSQGFRDLVDDARGVLTQLIAEPPAYTTICHRAGDLDLTQQPHFEIAQLTGAISPGNEVYRPGLWIVLKDLQSPPKHAVSEAALEQARAIIGELVKRLGLE
jgi:hypothetical protein